MSSLDVDWVCNFCHQDNTNRYNPDKDPECHTCDAGASWNIILTEKERGRLFKILEVSDAKDD